MRKAFALAIIEAFKKNNNIIFLTGDLGYMALESVRETLGDRFVNAGVAEQNMVTVAAALAVQGMIPWVYSIAPFVTLRPFEQIRNDVCFHRLPVKIVGNGGGFGYGIMGPTHHAPQDLGLMRLLPDMKSFIPVFDSDVPEAVERMLTDPLPNYLRLNLGIPETWKKQPFDVWRKLNDGSDAVIIAAGPVVSEILESDIMKKYSLEVWSVGNIPFGDMPDQLIASLGVSGRLVTIEEHVGPGGIGEAVAACLLEKYPVRVSLKRFYIQGYLSGRYGSQKWHLEENGIAGELLINSIEEFIRG